MTGAKHWGPERLELSFENIRSLPWARGLPRASPPENLYRSLLTQAPLAPSQVPHYAGWLFAGKSLSRPLSRQEVCTEETERQRKKDFTGHGKKTILRLRDETLDELYLAEETFCGMVLHMITLVQRTFSMSPTCCAMIDLWRAS